MVVNTTIDAGPTLNPSHEPTTPASPNKFPLSLATSQFPSARLLDSVRCSHNPSLALSRCSSAHWLFVLALSLLSCPFSNLACILLSASFSSSVLSGMHFPLLCFVSARLFMIC